MSELQIAQAIQTTIQAMSDFADADVVLNDWRILDGEIAGSPYVNIETAANFRSRQDTSEPNTTWEIPAELFVQFTEWKTSMDNLRTYRQAIVDAFNASGTARSAGGLEGTDINEIRSASTITPYYDKSVRPEDTPYVTPVFLSQRMLFICEEF